MSEDELELENAIQKIVTSKSPKKLIVAGPGAGKTGVFKKLLTAAKGDQSDRVVLTFINSLKDDLDKLPILTA